MLRTIYIAASYAKFANMNKDWLLRLEWEIKSKTVINTNGANLHDQLVWLTLSALQRFHKLFSISQLQIKSQKTFL